MGGLKNVGIKKFLGGSIPITTPTKLNVFNIDQITIRYFNSNYIMHQDGFILVFRYVLYDGHPPSVGPRGGIGVVMIIVGREYTKTLFFSCISWLRNYSKNYNLF